jgi:hypothetical protein
MHPIEYERLLRLAANIAATLERQRRLMDQAAVVLKQAERRLGPRRRVRVYRAPASCQ